MKNARTRRAFEPDEIVRIGSLLVGDGELAELLELLAHRGRVADHDDRLLLRREVLRRDLAHLLRGDLLDQRDVLAEEFRRQARGYRTRHLVKPGITGLAQSLGYRGEILETEMLNRRVYWDVYYITHWSVWLDLQITGRTLVQVFRPPQTAY